MDTSTKTLVNKNKEEQKCLIYSIGKLACSPSKKRSRSSVYAHKLARSVSFNDLAYNSGGIWCTALLWSPNHTLRPQTLWSSNSTLRTHEHALSHHAWAPGLRMIEAAFAWWDKAEWCHIWAPVHGTHEVTFWGRSLRLRVRRWPPDGWTAQRFMDERWLQGSSLWETGGVSVGRSVWPDRWRISPLVFTHAGRRWDLSSLGFSALNIREKGEKEKPRWDEGFQGVCRRETPVNILI